ncbi:MAG: hypothetical protein JWO09_2872 [Bacteroidetes bacterium]|nr:hypothetical protein [Bacteroidota bacterium]
MKYSIIFFLSCLLAGPSLAQQPAAGQPGSAGSYRVYESYNVLADNDKIKEGPYELWYKGLKIVSGRFSNNEKTGLWKFNNLPITYKNSDNITVTEEIYYQGSYSGNKKNGVWKYYLNKKPMCIICYKNDLKDSLWKSFYEDGKVRCIVNYKNGLKDSVFKYFHPNGTVSVEVNYKNGYKEGLHKKYDKDGKLLLSAAYVKGLMDGDFITYDTSGNVVKQVEYKNGNPYNVKIMNDANGKPLDYGTLLNGSGTYKVYKENKLSTEDTYENGKLNGLSKTFSPVTGKVIERGSYKDGIRMEDWVYYNSKKEAFEPVRLTNYLGTEAQDSVSPEKDDISYFAEFPAQPQGGVGELQPYFAANMAFMSINDLSYEDYYQPAKYSSGKVVESNLRFVVNAVGKLQYLEFGTKTGKEAEEKVLKAMRAMPPWVPGFSNGFPIDNICMLPVKIK